MRLNIFAVAALCLGVAVGVGCSSDDDSGGGKGGAGGGSAGAGGAGGGTAGAGGAKPASGGASGADAAGAAVTYAMVKPIFMAKCGACHTTDGPGKAYHTLASGFDDANKASYSCPGKKKGECTIVRIKAGTMPAAMPTGTPLPCKGNPAMDTDPKCTTADEQAKIQAWIDGGLKE